MSRLGFDGIGKSQKETNENRLEVQNGTWKDRAMPYPPETVEYLSRPLEEHCLTITGPEPTFSEAALYQAICLALMEIGSANAACCLDRRASCASLKMFTLSSYPGLTVKTFVSVSMLRFGPTQKLSAHGIKLGGDSTADKICCDIEAIFKVLWSSLTMSALHYVSGTR